MAMNIDEQRYKKYLKVLENYRPLDDDFMREMFRDNIPLSEMVLRIITGKYDLKITSQETQYDMKRLLGTRSVCLDVLATDSDGKLYNLEIQRADKGAPAKRARYHSSALDIEFLNAGDDYEKLPITYVIFITENDVRGKSKALYHFEMLDKDSGDSLGDGTHIIYVNAAYNKDGDNSDIAKLMHDFRCSNADDMNFELMAARARYFKETNEGVSYMCRLNEELIEDNAREIASSLIEMGVCTIEDIAKATKLPVEEVQKLAEKIKQTAK